MQKCLLNLYVDDLSRQAVEDDLQETFAAFGQGTPYTLVDEAGTTHPEHHFVVNPGEEGKADK